MFKIVSKTFKNKKEFYDYLMEQAKLLIWDETDLIANLSNISSLLFYSMENVSWIGFYLLKNDELVLGPFQGKPACVRIAIGKGVCGKSADKKKTIIVPNVEEFDGHIACDSEAKSEIVVPLLKNGKLIGVMDLDSAIINRFDQKDRVGLEKISKLICDLI